MVSNRLGSGTCDAAERDRRRGCAGGLEGATFRSARGIGSLRRRLGRVRCRFKHRHFRGRAFASRPRGRPPHRAALRPHRSGSLSAPPPLVFRVLFAGVGTPFTGRPRDCRPRDPGVGLALRLRRRSALGCDRSGPDCLRPALDPDCTGPALPRARVPLARRRPHRNWRHATPACGRLVLALRAVRGLRPRRVHHRLGAAPPPAARNVHVPPRHALGDPCKVERNGLAGRPRSHDPAHPSARARMVRGILRLVGHPRLAHMGHRCGRPGARARSAAATPTPGRRRRNDGSRSDPRGCSASSVNSGVGGPVRLASRWPGRRSRPRTPVRHGPRGHP